ncbi:Uma2 family endonuclease [uncultured Spirosoma sp.]|nr:Uma2 family endonuclease [uncultured Spirosoma sp.]MBN8823313.1 Uma2 family endonuclease [Spirosoma sp.]
MPNLTHGAIQANLVFELKTAYRNEYRIASEVTLATLPDGTTPDVVIYPAIMLDYQHEPAKRTDAPLVCIEIQSPSQSLEQMVDKTTIYFDFGVKSCWIVAPAVQGIFVYDRPGHYQFFYEADVLHDPNTGFELNLPAIFA